MSLPGFACTKRAKVVKARVQNLIPVSHYCVALVVSFCFAILVLLRKRTDELPRLLAWFSFLRLLAFHILGLLILLLLRPLLFLIVEWPFDPSSAITLTHQGEKTFFGKGDC